MKKVKILFCALFLLALTGCTFQNNGRSGKTEETAQISVPSGEEEADPFLITLGGGETVLKTPGEYTLTGSSTDAQITVDCPGEVTLRFENASLVSLYAPAIKVSRAESLTILLPEGSKNRICSGEEAELVPVSEHTGAAIRAKCDLNIEGSGTLSIEGYINNGIDCVASVRIDCGELSLKAANNGIKANSIMLDNGSVDMETGADGIRAYNMLTVNGGSFTVLAGQMGLKNVPEQDTGDTVGGICINGGAISVSSVGHCIRSSGEVLVNNGTLQLSSPDSRGIYADGAIRIMDGNIDTDVLDDGIFSASELTVEGGKLNICAGGDGLKAGGSRGNLEALIYINGGDIFISAYGDPVDANGGTFINGGKLFGLGISDQLKSFAPSSGQRWIFAGTVGAKGDKVEISLDDKVKESEAAHYGFNTVLYSAPDMSEGKTYTVTYADELPVYCTA